MKRAAVILAVLLVAGFLGFRWWRGPAPAEILASLEVPPSPTLSPAEEQATFRLAPGFRIELVAAEPLVVDPVAMDWDDEGRLYVVEMRGFMPDIDGTGEERPVGRIVVLEDADADGVMDKSHVFLDELVLPRAVAVLPEGVLVGVPPDLLLCRDTLGDRTCGEKTRLTDYAASGGNPEHLENGLLAALDGWIYNAKSDRRFRLEAGRLEIEETIFRGQWGIAQNDAGQLFSNHNSGFLYADFLPAEYAMRQPATAARLPKPGLNVDLAPGEEVFGVRVAPGLNRAYLEGSLRRDGRQRAPTGVSGLAIQRGDQFGPEWVGDAFVPEAAGAAVAHFAIEPAGVGLQAEHRLYADETFGKREFLASTDERFRPVDADFGPDGALYVIDMYRGVIQHADYVSDHLRAYVAAHDLAPPGATGRIWRVVREDRPLTRRPPSLAGAEAQLRALDHPNGWVRDRAQRRIAHERDPAAVAALRRLDDFTPLGRRHALWALHRLAALDEATWRRGLGDADAPVRATALRAGEVLLGQPGVEPREAIEPLLSDPDPAVRLQALHSLGSLPAQQRPLALLLAHGRSGDALVQQAVLSGLDGLEEPALRAELAQPDGPAAWWSELAAAAHLAAREDGTGAATARLLDLARELPDDDARVAVLEGIASAQRRPGSQRIELAERHPLFDPERKDAGAVAAVLARLRAEFTWPGDPRPGGARALTPVEEERRARGEALFAVTCATCHGAEGRGQPGLAPSLVGSPWVRDSEDWLARIALGGLTGPIVIDGEAWNLTMPGHRHDPRFDDDTLAGLLTHLRRSWGHAADPVAPATVARIRAETAERTDPWTAEELRALPIVHRLDRYVGIYEVPVVGIELSVQRDDAVLTIGRREGGRSPLLELGGGAFMAEGLTLQFELDDEGVVEAASAVRDGTAFPLTKTE